MLILEDGIASSQHRQWTDGLKFAYQPTQAVPVAGQLTWHRLVKP